MFWKKDKYLIAEKSIKKLIEWEGPNGCVVSKQILINGEKVGYMFRDSQESEVDSGWRFYSGKESNTYLNNYEDNLDHLDLNTVCNYDSDIIPLLNSPYGTAYRKNENGQFVKVPFE